MQEEKLLDVTTLNLYLKNLVEGDAFLSRVYIKGEISSLNKHYSGHYFFTLKDEKSKISCTMFSTYVNKMKYPVNNGDEVIIFGKVTVYDKAGTYQISVYSMEPYGEGQYLLKLKALKAQLEKEGLFSLPKKQIPQFPSKIGLITSKSGAAVHDLIHSITSRWPCEINIYPSQVQGEDAPRILINSLLQADNDHNDVLIMSRGGGANEDLKAFNDEALVRVAATLKTPLITAIGHEIDSSLVDLVADISCITPTEAGQKATPNIEDILYTIEDLSSSSTKAFLSLLHKKENEVLHLLSSKYLKSPVSYLNELLKDINALKDKANQNLLNILNNYDKNLMILMTKVNNLNPYLLLEKGYTLVKDSNNQVLTSVNDVKKDEYLTLQLKDGTLRVKVEEIKYGK
jgi:exodeoxyribonuclease VII large subunit